MDRVLTMTVFRRVAELHSFSAAARDLGLSNAAVSKHVALLEDRLRARLLQRTTRSVALTAAGAAYLERCARILDDIAELDQAVMQAQAAPKGLLRVNAPSAFGVQYLAPVMPALLAAHPELEVELSFTDRFVDLVEEAVDVVIRIASQLPDSATLVAQRLVGVEHRVVAAPGYLERRGVPKRPADLAKHECLVYGLHASEWTFHGRGTPISVPVSGRYRVDNSLALREAVLAGVGLALMPQFYIDEDIRQGRLRVVLDTVRARPAWIHAVYPRQRHLSTKIRVFIEHVRAALQREPWAMRP